MRTNTGVIPWSHCLKRRCRHPEKRMYGSVTSQLGNISLVASCLIFPKMQKAANLTKPIVCEQQRSKAWMMRGPKAYHAQVGTLKDIKTNPLLHLGPIIEIAWLQKKQQMSDTLSGLTLKPQTIQTVRSFRTQLPIPSRCPSMNLPQVLHSRLLEPCPRNFLTPLFWIYVKFYFSQLYVYIRKVICNTYQCPKTKFQYDCLFSLRSNLGHPLVRMLCYVILYNICQN